MRLFCTFQKKKDNRRCRKNIADLAEANKNICEIEKQLLLRKYEKENEVLEIKKANQLLKQQILQEKLAYIKEQRQRSLDPLL